MLIQKGGRVLGPATYGEFSTWRAGETLCTSHPGKSVGSRDRQTYIGPSRWVDGMSLCEFRDGVACWDRQLTASSLGRRTRCPCRIQRGGSHTGTGNLQRVQHVAGGGDPVHITSREKCRVSGQADLHRAQQVGGRDVPVRIQRRGRVLGPATYSEFIRSLDGMSLCKFRKEVACWDRRPTGSSEVVCAAVRERELWCLLGGVVPSIQHRSSMMDHTCCFGCYRAFNIGEVIKSVGANGPYLISKPSASASCL